MIFGFAEHLTFDLVEIGISAKSILAMPSGSFV